ncbi:MAG: hypothetical protein Q9191_007901 [Dirinaria sp. TL-2023a]
MAAVDSHTPLEKFLLFHTLHPFDNEIPSFPTVSETLKSSTVFPSKASSDESRLKPEALQELYLRLVKEEAKLELHGNASSTKAGDTATQHETPPSPHMANVTDVIQHKNLLPRILDRLYFQYRDHAIKAIEDEERNIRQLRKEIDEIRRTEREVPTRKSSINTLLRHDTVEDRPSSRDSLSQTPLPPNGTAKTVSTPNEEQAQAAPQKDVSPPAMPTIPSSVAETQPTVTTAPSQPDIQDTLSIPTPPSTQTKTQNYPTTSPQLGRPSIPSDPSRQNLALSQSPRPNQGPYTGPERASGSPIILPPPAGMQHSGSPPGPLEPLTDMAAHRPRPTPPSQRPTQPASQHPPPPQPPPAQFAQHSYMPQPYPYFDGRSQYPYQPYPQTSTPKYQNHPGYPPYQTPVQNPGHVPPYANASAYQTPLHFPQYSNYGQTSYYPQTPRQGPFNPPSYPASAQQTPTATASGKPRPPKPSPIITSASSTRYKGIDYSAFKPQPSPTRPGPDEISPISDRAPSLPADESGLQEKDASSSRTRTRAKPSKGAKAPRSQPAERASTRSQSFASPVAEPRAVKHEPATPAVSTAAETDTADETGGVRKSTRPRRNTLRGLEAAEESTRTAPSTKRKRANTNEEVSVTPIAGLTHASPPSSSASLTPATPAPALPLGGGAGAGLMQTRSGYVLGSRNLPRTSQTLMNDISSHKLAGLFARPLTEREAPGYKELIYRPQDLKSIKSAIVAGSRALGSATATSAGAADGGGASVHVPISADVMPPRGIVNSAQLEKELMRVFANAVMFNPDPKRGLGPVLSQKSKGNERHVPPEQRTEGQQDVVDAEGEENEAAEEQDDEDEEGGVVADAREMFEAVDAALAHWRQAERAGDDLTMGIAGRSGSVKAKEKENDDVDELAGDVRGETENTSPARVVGKRRKR